MPIEQVIAIVSAIAGPLISAIVYLVKDNRRLVSDLVDAHKTSAKELDATARKVADGMSAQTSSFASMQAAYEKSADRQAALSQTVTSLVSHIQYLSAKAGREPTPPPFPAVQERR